VPHLTLDYSADLTDRFDRAELVRQLHPLVLHRSGSAGLCKTRCHRVDETFVGDGAQPFSFVHVEIGLLPGRSEDVKARLSEEVLALLTRHLDDAVLRSVEVRDLAASYRLSPGGPAAAPRCPRLEPVR
jgi:5-carboxymethyl-2-hydroxymuconate isomerase